MIDSCVIHNIDDVDGFKIAILITSVTIMYIATSFEARSVSVDVLILTLLLLTDPVVGPCAVV